MYNLCNILASEMANFSLRAVCPEFLQLQFPAVRKYSLSASCEFSPTF